MLQESLGVGRAVGVRASFAPAGRTAKSASEQDGATFLSVPRGQSGECQSSPGWGDGALPHPGKAGCTWSRRKEGEEVRLQGFPGALSLLRSWRMRQESEETFSWPASSTQPSAEGNETAGQLPLAPKSVCQRMRPGLEKEGTPHVPHVPTQQYQARVP